MGCGICCTCTWQWSVYLCHATRHAHIVYFGWRKKKHLKTCQTFTKFYFKRASCKISGCTLCNWLQTCKWYFWGSVPTPPLQLAPPPSQEGYLTWDKGWYILNYFLCNTFCLKGVLLIKLHTKLFLPQFFLGKQQNAITFTNSGISNFL